MECLNNKTCKEGYYLPYDALTYEDCQKCSIEGCIECEGTYFYNECIQCNDNSISLYKHFKIADCKCFEGYYLPYDDDINCKKCSVNNCKKCNGTKNYDECTDCRFWFKNIYENSKIVDCNCYDGYYLPYDDDTDCKKCSVKHCKKCNGTKNYDECTDCGDLKAIYENGIIK